MFYSRAFFISFSVKDFVLCFCACLALAACGKQEQERPQQLPPAFKGAWHDFSSRPPFVHLTVTEDRFNYMLDNSLHRTFAYKYVMSPDPKTAYILVYRVGYEFPFVYYKMTIKEDESYTSAGIHLMLVCNTGRDAKIDLDGWENFDRNFHIEHIKPIMERDYCYERNPFARQIPTY